MIDGPIPEALTFDDVLLLPGKSSILPTEVDPTTKFTRKLALNITLVRALGGGAHVTPLTASKGQR